MTMFSLPGQAQLQKLGLDIIQSRPPTSGKRFPDEGAWRITIPSVEGPEPRRAVLDEAARLGVPVHRVSQGSGVMMHCDRVSAPLGRSSVNVLTSLPRYAPNKLPSSVK